MTPADPLGFARVRRSFHELLAYPLAERDAALSRLQHSDPELAAAVTALYQAADTDDLQRAQSLDGAPQGIGNFRLLRRIGNGGMGEVWEAERELAHAQQRVAIKLLHGGRMPAEARTRFLREHRILARLTHPHIASFIEAGVSARGQAWLAMEYIDGERLDVHCRRTEIGVDARIALFLQLCAAVHYAHLHLVVHRDIKPANVLVSAHAGAKLLDFGIAKLLDDSEADLTLTGMQAMTARYAAPEQVGAGNISVGTDVYALGVLLFEMLSGHSPYARAQGGSQSYAQSVIDEDMQPLTPLLMAADHGRSLSRRRINELELILRHALAKATDARYSSVAALADDLRDWQAQTPLRSGIGGSRARLRYVLRLYRVPLLAAAAVLIAVSVSAWVALLQAHRAEQETRRAEAHMTVLLDVLGSANPGIFAGREALASDLLIAASGRLQLDAADDPRLLRRALSEIGHGLINLGHEADAEQVLLSALRAMDRETDVDARRSLGLLKLLVLTQDEWPRRERLLHTVARIERVAAEAGAPPGLAIDALASAAGALSRLNEFAEADRLFAITDRIWRAHPQATPSERENYHRQRGWAALRAGRFAFAHEEFKASLAVMTAAPADFAPLRVAEAHWLLAEAALGFDPALAIAPIEAAAPIVLAHYPEGHAERAQFQLLQAQLAFTRKEYSRVEKLLDIAEPILRQHHDVAHAWISIDLLRAAMVGVRGDCTRITIVDATISAQSPPSPRLLQQQQSIREVIDSMCR